MCICMWYMIDLSYFNPRKELFVRFIVNGEKNNNSEIGKILKNTW